MCPVCFNAAAADDTVRASLNLGILVMMAVTAGVLAGFLRFMIAIVRRSSSADLTGLEADLKRSKANLKVRLCDSVAESPAYRNLAEPPAVEAGL